MLKLSIITINLNNAQGLQKTIESVVNQSFNDFEYIIIDGASTDDSIEVIKKKLDKISYWISEPDTGIYNAMNKGIRQATGEYCLFLNSGDYFDSNHVLKDILNCYPKEDLLIGKLAIKANPIAEISNIKEIPDLLKASYLFNDFIPHPATFIRRSLFNTIGLYNEENQIVSDWEFFLKALLIQNASYRKIGHIISVFLTDGLSCKEENATLITREKEHIIERYFPLYSEDYKKYNDLAKSQQLYSVSSEKKVIDFLKKIKIIPLLCYLYNAFIKIIHNLK